MTKKKEMWTRNRGLCDYCQKTDVPVTFLKFLIGLQIRLCKDCMKSALAKLDSDGGTAPPKPRSSKLHS